MRLGSIKACRQVRTCATFLHRRTFVCSEVPQVPSFRVFTLGDHEGVFENPTSTVKRGNFLSPPEFYE